MPSFVFGLMFAASGILVFACGVKPAAAEEGPSKILCNHKLDEVVDFTGKIESRGGADGMIQAVKLERCKDRIFQVSHAAIPASCKDSAAIKGSGKVTGFTDPTKPEQKSNFLSDWTSHVFGQPYIQVNAESVSCN